MSMSTPVAPGSTTPRWSADPTGRHQLRWWDGTTWTDQVADDQQQSVDPLSTALTAPPVPTDAGAPAASDWRTRPEGVGTFIGNLVLCLLFPFFVLWFAPKYVMRREYVKAIACVVVVIAAFVLVAALTAGAAA